MTELPREIVAINTAAPDSGELHFRADSLSVSSDKIFYIYYGNSTATDYAISDPFGAENVWASGYVAVWHLEEGSSGPWLDSTTNDNDAVLSGSSVISINAQIERGLDWPGASGGDYATLPTVGMTIGGDQLTLSGWARTPSVGVDNDEALINGDGTNYPYMIGMENGGGAFDNTNCRITNTSGTLRRLNIPAVPRGVWTWLTCRYDGSNLEAYVDSAFVGGGSITGNILGLTNAWFARRSDTRRYEGDMDELRVQNTARTPEWISTEYNNQSAPASFFVVGAEEQQGVANTPPSITGTGCGGNAFSHSPDPGPVVVGNDVTFCVDWDDVDPSDTAVTVYVCKTTGIDAVTGCDGGPTDTWTTLPSTSFDPENTGNLFYTTTALDVGSRNYEIYVCDDEPECSANAGDVFTVGATPIIVNDVRNDGPVLEGFPITFDVDWSDPDSGTTNLFICKTDGIGIGGCDGGVGDTWASTSGAPGPTATATYPSVIGDAGTYSYYAFVCDSLGCSATTESGPDTHRTFSITVQSINITSFTANPPSGPEPLNSSLQVDYVSTAAGTTANYSFWWNCTHPGTSVSDVINGIGGPACGDPSDLLAGVGEKYDAVTVPPYTQSTGSHTYNQVGSPYTAKVIVEQGGAAAKTSFATITVSSVPSVTFVDGLPDPVLVGGTITFTVGWFDPDGDRVRAHICKGSTMTIPTVCDGGSWRDSPLDTDPPGQINLFYTPNIFDIGLQNYWAFVCDENNVCSPSGTPGTFNVGAAPVITANVSDNGPVLENNPITFFVPWSDSDDTTVNVYICDSDGATAGAGCAGNTWASTSWFSPTGSAVAQAFYITQPGDAATSPHSYWAFVCDSSECSATSPSPLTFNQFDVTTQLLSIDSFFAIPPSGPDPLSSFLEVEFSGTGSDDVNYNYWWDCNSSADTVSQTFLDCNPLNTPPPGSCIETIGVGYKCNGIAVPPFVHQSISHDYLSGGPYTGKVIVERGSLSREARTTITVSVAPTIVPPTNDFPDPVLVDNPIQFEVFWTDPDPLEQVRGHVCKSDKMTFANVCDDGPWTEMGTSDGNSPINLWYDTTGANVATSPNNYWIFVCDDEGGCSAPWSGTFVVTFAPIITADVFHTPEPALEGATITFQVFWADDDASVNVYLCDSDSATISGCTGGTRASTVASSSPAVLTLDTTPLGAGNYHYWAFVCDTTQCSSTSDSSPRTHEDFNVTGQIVTIDSFTANPPSGTSPLDVVLDVSISGNTSDDVNYTFWWDCDHPGTSVSDVRDGIGGPACGDPFNPVNGEKYDGVSATSQQTLPHTYSSNGLYRAKVIVERGLAPARERRVDVTVSSAPTITPPVIVSPPAVLVGQQVNFTINWTDPDSTEASGHICRTPFMTVPADCDPVGPLGSFTDSPISSDPSLDLSYTTTVADAGLQFFYAFVCDDLGACTPTPTAGTFSVEFTPVLTQPVSHTPEPALQGDIVRFDIFWGDPDSSSVNVYVCDTQNFTYGIGCDDNEWAFTTASSSPAQPTVDTASVAPGTHDYFVYVCDNIGCSPFSEGPDPPDSHQQFTVTATTLNITNFTATPPSGPDPLDVILGASVDGTATGTINYSFWWDCTHPGTSVSDVVNGIGGPACGDPSDLLAGVGEKYDGVGPSSGPHTQATNSHPYSPNGIYTGKVIVERGEAVAQERRISVTVSARPVISSVDVSPPVVVAGQQVNFTINWTDADSPQASGHICRTPFMTNPADCDPPGPLGSFTDSPVSSDPSLDLSYTTQISDKGPNTFWAFVCDNSFPIPVCGVSMSGNFDVRLTPVITFDVDHTPKPALEGDTITFDVEWSDPDGLPGSVTVYVCDAVGVTVGGGCSGGEWASETTSFTLAQPTLDTTGLSAGLYDYYAYVCDNLGCSGLSETSPDTHKQFEISGQVIIIDTFDAIPPSGVAPLTSSLEVSISGTANDTINYSFWWDCNDAGIVPGTGLGEVGDICGALTAPAGGFCTETPGVGYKCDGVGPLFGPDTQFTVDHVYPLGSYTGKVIVERGDALAVEDRTDVDSTLNTFPSIISVTNNGPVDEGDTIFFDVTWKDDEGITPLPGYVVVCKSDVAPTGFLPSGPTCPDDHWDNGPVAVGGSGTTTTVLYSTQAGDIGTWTGWAYVCQAEDECSTPVSNDFEVQTPSPAADLIDIELSTVFTSYDIGDSFSYELRVTNNGIGGLIDALNVEVVVTLPSEVAIQNPIPLCGSPAVSDPPPTVGATGVTVTCGWTTISVGASPVELFNVTAVTEKINAVATATLTAVSPEDDSPAPGYSGNNADIAIVTIGDTSSNPPPTLIDQFRIPSTVSQGPSIFWDDELAGGPFNAQNVNVSVSGEISLADPGLGFGHITSVPIDTRAQDGVAFNAIRWDGDRPGTESDPRFVVYDWMYSKGSGPITVNCGQLPGGNTPGPGVDPFTSPPGPDDPVCDAHPSGEWFMDVSIETGRYSGWIWSDLIGWIALSCDTAFVDNCDLPAFSLNRWGQSPNHDMVGWGVWEDPGPWQKDAGTDVQYRRVRGWAWSPIAGWIAMGCDSQGLSVCGAVWDGVVPSTDGYDGTDPSSSVAPYRGNADSVWVSNDVGVMRYHGWAWSSHIGWISFDCNQVLPGASGQRQLYNCTDDGIPGEADHAYNPWRLGVGGSAEVRFWVATSDCPNGASNPPTCTGISDWEFIDSACTVQNEPDPNLGGGSPYNLFPISDPMATEDRKIGDLSQCPDQHWNKRYARYRVLLCTFNDCIIPGIWRPIVRDVLITYSP